MKNNKLKKSINMLIIAAGLSSTLAQAVPWCHRGTIVQIADVTWGESSIVANYPGSIPGDIPPYIVGNVNNHITFMSTNQYASSFAGGGGGFGGYSVPGSGQVKVYAYAPHNYITAPTHYDISEGVKFKLKKCYTIPPMVVVHELREFIGPITPGDPNSPIGVEPLERLYELGAYWEKSKEEQPQR